jgi:hypothetical protein
MLKSPREGPANRPYFAYKIFGLGSHPGGGTYDFSGTEILEKFPDGPCKDRGGTTFHPGVCLSGRKFLLARAGRWRERSAGLVHGERRGPGRAMVIRLVEGLWPGQCNPIVSASYFASLSFFAKALLKSRGGRSPSRPFLMIRRVAI